MAKVAPQASETEDCILSAFESGMGGMLGEGITTVTFFNGDVKAAAEYLKQRLALVAAANPWIFGHLVKEKQHAKRAALRTPKVAPPVSEEVYELNEALKLSEEMPYEDMVKAVQKSSAYVPMGRKLLNKRRPVSKLSVAPTVGGGGFAVIFSLSHTVCNGGTYYQILNMLSSNGAIVAMDPRRKEELAEKPKEFMGKAHYAYLNGGTNALNGLGKIAFGKNPKAHCFLVDDAKLNAAKAEAKAKPGAPERISSNDVLTSAFASLCKSRVFIMAVDFKGKIEGTTVTDAGQYHSGILLDRNGYGEPAAIRTALSGTPPLSNCELPQGFREGLGCSTGMITSWAALKDLDIPSCTLALHTPCAPTSGMVVKSQNDTCIVFNPKPGKIAMLCMCTSVGSKGLLASLPFQGPLSDKMWPPQ